MRVFKRVLVWSTQLREAITEFQGVSSEDDDLYL